MQQCFSVFFFFFMVTKHVLQLRLKLKCTSIDYNKNSLWDIDPGIIIAFFLTWIDFQFQYLGNISMSLYLIHEALLRWMIFACRGSVSWSNLSPEDFGSNLPIPQTIKGQLISKCLYEVIVWTKIPTKNLIISALKGPGQKLSKISSVFWSKR